ncbi:MAG: hypothetical protein V2A73_17565 [Pseudomonadota bacterium]
MIRRLLSRAVRDNDSKESSTAHLERAFDARLRLVPAYWPPFDSSVQQTYRDAFGTAFSLAVRQEDAVRGLSSLRRQQTRVRL